jgi:glutamine cyclotransferase
VRRAPVRLTLVLVLVAAGLAVAVPALAAPTVPWRLVAERSHDPDAYTQGLVAHRGVLLESTGLYGASSVRRLDPETGRVLKRVALPDRYFGEGLTVHGGRAVQLTWLEQRVLFWSPGTLAARGSRAYDWEGWGLTTDGTSLIASDGSDTLRFLDPATLAVRRSVAVRDGSIAVPFLNELEYRDGIVWANVYRSDRIALIDPATGRVRGWLDLARLRSRLGGQGEVLNGIARDPVSGHMVVTGKLWPRMFAIRLAGRVSA